jgi:hypothetical protein
MGTVPKPLSTGLQNLLFSTYAQQFEESQLLGYNHSTVSSHRMILVSEHRKYKTI